MGKEISKKMTAFLLIVMMLFTSAGPGKMTAEAASSSYMKSYSVKIGSTDVKKKTYSIYEGEKRSLSVSVNPSTAKQSVTFKASDSKVATVDQYGNISAKKSGTTKIIISIKPKKGKTKSTWMKIKVLPLINEKSVLMIQKGTQSTLSRGNLTGTKKWTSSNTSIIQVNSSGRITAVSYGSAIVTCSGSNGKMTYYMNVPNLTGAYEYGDMEVTDKNLKSHNYRIFSQLVSEYGEYTGYVNHHGCAICSLTCVLRGQASGYENVTLQQVITGIEKRAIPSSKYAANYKKTVKKQMPLTLYGICKVLNTAGVPTKYVPFFSNASAKSDIIAHVKTGSPVMIEVSQKNRKTNKSDGRWTKSYHTMVILGVFTDGKVLVTDSADRSWYKGYQRLKVADLSDLMNYMFPCTKKPSSSTYYFSGRATDGGYIKVK